MITNLDSKILDLNSEALGVSVDILMDSAGEQLADIIADLHSEKRILFVCGSGNNGGDGFAAANHLENLDVSVALLTPENKIKTKAAQNQFSKVKAPILEYSDDLLEKFDVVIDCALGTGLKKEPRDTYAEFIKKCKSFEGFVISADVPSGFGTNLSILPDLTVTFHDLKEGMSEENCGKIIVADIGISDDASFVVGPGDLLRYPIPDKNSHKGNNGKLLVIGGGLYAGAPALSGLAAFRVGTDLVKLAVPCSVYEIVSSYSPCFTVLKLNNNLLTLDDLNSIHNVANDFDVTLIGPGLGTDSQTKAAVKEIIKDCNHPIVIDADALTALAEMNFKFEIPAILTPHNLEFGRLVKESVVDRQKSAEEYAKKTNSIVVLKGTEDIITDGIHTRINKSGNAAMTCGGTGDVLSGIVAGLLSKGMSTFDAACVGTYICGKAGEIAFEDKFYGLISTDVIESIPAVLKTILKE